MGSVRVKKRAGAAAPPRQEGPRVLFASAAVPGRRYCNWTKSEVVALTGKSRDGLLAFSGWSRTGESSEASSLSPWCPLVESQEWVDEVMACHEKAVRAHRWKLGKEPADTGEVDETGEVAPRRRAAPARSRGAVNPATAYPEGTDGNAFGILALKAGNRKAAVAAIVPVLMERGRDERGARALAQSWVSTLVRKDPELYKSLKG